MSIRDHLDQAISYLDNKTILLTGCLGFVGNNALDYFSKYNINIIGTDYYDIDSIDNNLSSQYLSKIEYVQADITNSNDIERIFQNYDFDSIIHLASLTDLSKDFTTSFKSIEVNTKGTLNLLEKISKFNKDRFIFLSTSDVYGLIEPPFRENQPIYPASPYSISKASAEMFCNLFANVYNLPITILRAFNIYGKYQTPARFIPYVINNLIEGKEVNMTLGEQKREYNYVENLLDAILLSLGSENSVGKTINIGNGKSTAINAVANKICNYLNSDPKLLKFGNIEYRKNEIWDMYCDNQLAKEILQWEPHGTLDQGLAKTIEWFKSVKV